MDAGSGGFQELMTAPSPTVPIVTEIPSLLMEY